MALQFIFGNSGSGKSEYIYQHILAEAQKDFSQNFFILVPEQFTIEVQRDFVLRQSRNGLLNIDVVSFNRLAYRVFHELGMNDIKVLEETGKNFVLRKAAEKKKGELKVLGSSVKKNGYISELKSIISELTQYRIGPEDLVDFLEDERNPMAFRLKLRDINAIYEEFLSFLEGNFITSEELLKLLAENCRSSRMLAHSVIVLDGFTGFTPVQFYLLEQLMSIVKDIYVAVTLDEREDPWHTEGPHELFYMSKLMISSLSRLAVKAKMEILPPLLLWHTDKSRFAGSEQLLWLEQNLFRKRHKIYAQTVTDLSLHCLRNPREEVIFAAEEISRLVREEGYRYKEIAIVCGNMEIYANYVDEIFDQYEIPRFLDRKKNLLFHPMTEFIRGSLLMVEFDFSYEHVFAFLRLSLTGYADEEVDLLENYVLANRIRGFSKWKQKWIRLYGVDNEEELAQVNELRGRLTASFESLYPIVKSKEKTAADKTKQLYLHLCENEMQKRLKAQGELFLQKKEVALAKEYDQVYKIVMDLLDKLVNLLGDEKMSVKEYREILETGFEAAGIGIVPPGYDRVVCGDMERTRLSHIKILFFIGVNDGFIPQEANNCGIITEQERELLSRYHLELAPAQREKNFMQRFYLYLNVTKPSQKLYISYFRVSKEGKETKRSYFIGLLKKIFPTLTVNNQSRRDERRRIITPEGSMGYFTEKLMEARAGKVSALWTALYHWYEDHAPWGGEIAPFFDATFAIMPQEVLPREITKRLYEDMKKNSVSRLERFCSCAFSHFLTYGLAVQERDLGELEAADMGNLFHASLERYARKIEEHGWQWQSVSQELRSQLIQDAIFETVAENQNPGLFDGARNQYTIERMRRILIRSIEAITSQMAESNFSPEDYELSFSIEKSWSDFKLGLRGRIDRLDTRKVEDKLYVKVVDYKSGSMKFKLLSVYYGLSLQLVVYLDAAMDLMKKRYPGREILPSGMFYYHIEDPMIEAAAAASDQEIKEKILAELKLQGIGCDAEDRSVSKKSEQADAAQLQILKKYVNHKIHAVGKEIYEGNIAAAPFSLGDETGCDYCPYFGVCGFDPSLPGFAFRRLPQIKKNEMILDKMKGELEEDE